MRVPLGVAATVVLTTLGAANPATALPAQRSEPAKPDYGLSLEQPYLTSDVGGTLTARPKVFTSRPDGSRVYVPEGAPLGAGIAIKYRLPEDTSPVGLDEHKSCRKVKSATDPGRLRIRCDTVSPRRETVGAALLGVAGGFGVLAVLVLFLTRARARRTMWALCTAAALCAGLGTWSVVHGPVLGTKTFTRGYPAGPATLETPELIWDSGAILEEKRPDYVPTIATAPDPDHESVTEVSALYRPAVSGYPYDWLTLDGAYGRIEDPRRARNHMLETAAGAPGVKVVKKPELIVLRDDTQKKQPVLFKCQALSIRNRTFAMCAWADSGVRALVTIAGDSLLTAAGKANSLRHYVQLNRGF
ncbi:hypothetical protein [Streptomyces mirabilis]|uniref:hypothetical protein n=1 Tax=Streptomyces mirabilis TaxID=68239 RepID=UPI00225ACD9F|nr:hypothetical protein [Streptomyces mirabilis]MCX4436128.1 hypothetical protein [Streptomyces mirabilis]